MRLLISLLVTTQLLGCAAFTDYGYDRELTVGTVQREIRIGMSGADVAEALGSPNIVSTDNLRNEVWIYDKISSTSVRMQTHTAPATLTLFDVLGPLTTSSSTLRSTDTERTLTVVIKFDGDKRVNDFAYHTSRF